MSFFHDALDDGVASLLDEQFAVVGEFGTAIVAFGGKVREAGEHVDFRQHRRGLAQTRGFVPHLAADTDEKVTFERVAALLGLEDFDFQFLQLRGGEALGIDQRLFTLVIGRRQMQVRFGDFDIVAKDVVEAHLE